MKFWQFLLALGLGFILVKCAQPRPITGGDKDETPPQITHSIPQNLSKGFNGHTIMLEFDEYVVVKSLAAELVVSPPLQYPVEYKIKGKRVYFEIKDTLLENTTYNFNFGNAIVDLNESNALDSNLFVISTGNFIDSGSISGFIKDSYTQKPIKNAVVLLYDSYRDSALYNGKPSYIAKTDGNGAYELKYLAHKNYQIFSLEHSSTDYKYMPFANVGFYNKLVDPIADDAINLVLFHEEDTNQFVSKEFSRAYFAFNVGLHSPLVNPEFSFIPSEDTVRYIIEEIKSDSFKFWIEGDRDMDSVYLFIHDDLGFQDTVKMDLASRKKFYKKLKRKDQKNSPLKVRPAINSGLHHYFDTLHVNFSRPILKWDLNKMFFIHGSDTMPMDSLMKEDIITASLPTSDRGSSKELRTMVIDYDWQPNQKYGFIFNQGAFTDIINQVNDTTVTAFKTNTFEDYGSFRLTINVPDYNGPLVLELLNKDSKFLRNYFVKSGDVIYHELSKPGKYQLRLILDRNGNKKWDTGDLSKQAQPEEVIYYKGIIEIRSNWDMEETWNVELK